MSAQNITDVGQFDCGDLSELVLQVIRQSQHGCVAVHARPNMTRAELNLRHGAIAYARTA
jgi:hypothetical protein